MPSLDNPVLYLQMTPPSTSPLSAHRILSCRLPVAIHGYRTTPGTCCTGMGVFLSAGVRGKASSGLPIQAYSAAAVFTIETAQTFIHAYVPATCKWDMRILIDDH